MRAYQRSRAIRRLLLPDEVTRVLVIAEPTGVRIIEVDRIPFGPDGRFDDPIEFVRQFCDPYPSSYRLS